MLGFCCVIGVVRKALLLFSSTALVTLVACSDATEMSLRLIIEYEASWELDALRVEAEGLNREAFN